MASKFSKLVQTMENCCRFVKQLKNNVTTTMNKYYTFKWQLEITEFSPILMPSSTIEFITTEDFGMGVQFWNNKIATANKNLERKLVSSAKLQNGRNFRKTLLKTLSRVSFVDRPRGALATTTATATSDVKKAIGLLRKTITLQGDHAFLYISLPSSQDYDMKMPNCKFYGGHTYIHFIKHP